MTPRPGQGHPQAVKLVVDQSVHGIDQHGDDTLRRALIAQAQAVIDDGQHEGFGLAGAGPRAQDDVLTGMDRVERLGLVVEQFVVGETRRG